MLELPITGKWLKDHGVGQTTLRNFLEGFNNSLTVETLSKLSEPLKTTEKWLLFGDDAEPISEGLLHEMADLAVEEIQAGMRIEQIRNAVASALRGQLKLHLSVGAGLSSEGEASAPDTGAQSPSPNKGGEKGGSRNA